MYLSKKLDGENTPLLSLMWLEDVIASSAMLTQPPSLGLGRRRRDSGSTCYYEALTKMLNE